MHGDGPVAFHVMTKPVGPVCNLDCRYCFYLEKRDLYPGNRRWRMSDEVLESYVRQYIEAQDAPEVHFAWQGGEPTLMGLPFFRKVVELQRRHAGGKTIHNALQTNGTLLDDEWCAFLAENRFLVGLSIDGPRDLHDAHRVGRKGEPTFDRVLAAMRLLSRLGVEFNTLTVVNSLNAERPLDVYRLLVREGSRYLQFIPIVERGPAGEPTAETVSGDQWGAFLCAVYDEWVVQHVGRVFVQLFDATLNAFLGLPNPMCVFAPECGRAMALEHNGDLYSCDHFVYPENRLGNILLTPLRVLAESPQQRAFGEAKRTALTRACRRCPVLFACNGDCPKHRFALSPDGETGHSHLCAGYFRFFQHAAPTMLAMADLLRAGQPPALVMERARAERAAKYRGVGRNDPCPCGSGRKFKACCAPRLR